ncbi:hypothetical protein AACT_2572 [Arcobacter acticola]|uniref:Glycosyl transferase n=1 Tax=Arcobacter acticola TaxID=1849015 RepID=A0A6M8EYK9_9BACT|nr:DUF6625 family protein [Arcobacter acticola]QKE29655.1 hypothetical protein AACT_2572 [Arcobacter acticola]
MANNCLLIIVYFGVFNEVLKKSLDTLTDNNVDVFLFTDKPVLLEEKENLWNHQISRSELESLTLKTLNISQEFNDYYKLCDFKIFYYSILKQYIQKQYDYIGFCDLDVVFGNLDYFLNKPITEKANVVGSRGHLMLFETQYYKKITSDLLKLNSIKRLLESNENYALDEFEFLHIYLEKEKSKKNIIWNQDISLKAVDLNYFTENYICVNRKLVLTSYLKKNLNIEVIFENSQTEYIPYIHFQKRKINDKFFKENETVKITKQSKIKNFKRFISISIQRIKTKLTTEPIIKKKLLSKLFRNEIENSL